MRLIWSRFQVFLLRVAGVRRTMTGVQSAEPTPTKPAASFLCCRFGMYQEYKSSDCSEQESNSRAYTENNQKSEHHDPMTRQLQCGIPVCGLPALDDWTGTIVAHTWTIFALKRSRSRRSGLVLL